MSSNEQPTEEEQTLLSSLAEWLNGREFRGSTNEDASRQHIAHYGRFCRDHLDIDWPAVTPESTNPVLTCCICSSHELSFPHTLLDRSEAEQFCRHPGICCLPQWSSDLQPHVSHKECYIAGYLDSVLERGGCMMTRDYMRWMPSRISRTRLLDLFDAVAAGEEALKAGQVADKAALRVQGAFGRAGGA